MGFWVECSLNEIEGFEVHVMGFLGYDSSLSKARVSHSELERIYDAYKGEYIGVKNQTFLPPNIIHY
jgi:hypothetical protein